MPSKSLLIQVTVSTPEDARRLFVVREYNLLCPGMPELNVQVKCPSLFGEEWFATEWLAGDLYDQKAIPTGFVMVWKGPNRFLLGHALLKAAIAIRQLEPCVRFTVSSASYGDSQYEELVREKLRNQSNIKVV